MSLSPEDVKKIAHLARLNLSESASHDSPQQLAAIFHFIEQLNEVDTANVEPLAHPLDIGQRLRLDIVTEPDLHREFQALAPQVEAGLYLVPIVIEEA